MYSSNTFAQTKNVNLFPFLVFTGGVGTGYLALWDKTKFGCTDLFDGAAVDADKYNAIANAAQVQMETTEETPIEIQSRKDMRGQLKRHGLYNYANLNTQEKGWLWHHIFGCMPHARLRKIEKNGTYMGLVDVDQLVICGENRGPDMRLRSSRFHNCIRDVCRN